MSAKSNVVTSEPTITLSNLTFAQGELIMAALRSFHTEDGTATAIADAQDVEDALEAAGICRKGRLPTSKNGKTRTGPVRKYYVAAKSPHSLVMRSVKG